MDDMQTKTFSAGDVIIEKGAPADTAYMIESGLVQVYLEQDGKIVDLASLGVEQIFGETSLFNGATYGANVKAVEDTVVALITPEILRQKVGGCDPMLRAMVKMLIERLQRTNEALVESETREFIDIAFV